MVGHADALLWFVLGVVVRDHGGEGAAEDLDAASVHLIMQPLLEVALRQGPHECHADTHPQKL